MADAGRVTPNGWPARHHSSVIQGISAIARSRVFVGGAHYVFGDLRAWGWIALIFGVLQLVAGVGVLLGNQLARWFGIAVLGLNAIDQMFFIPFPFWSLTIIAMDVVAPGRLVSPPGGHPVPGAGPPRGVTAGPVRSSGGLDRARLRQRRSP